mgnify:CR=1 FL=1|tara:strand:- start:808 stop:1566 length:759 start_codon:yes stop_codon:yes gene_type:complete
MLEISRLKKDLSKILYNNKSIRVLFKNHLSSTNDFFKYKYIKDQCPIIITTNNQRAARGRNSKIWFSFNQKSLSFSFCLKLNADQMELVKLNYLSCLAILRAFKNTTNHTFSIKWPNDIYLNNKKVSGILIESQSCGKDIFLSLGVGININIDESFSVNQPHSNLGMNIDYIKLVYLFCENLVNFLNAKNHDGLVEEYNTNLFAINKNVSVSICNVTHVGILSGINNCGGLVIKTDNKVLTINDINSTLRLV